MITRADTQTVIVSLVTAGVMGMLSHYVSAQTSNAVLGEKLADHTKQIDHLESAAASMARTEENLSATQKMLIELTRRLERRHDRDVRDLRRGR